jgi:L-glyceraldehyde 3-phosphate reductase
MTYVPADDRYEHMRYRRSGRSGLQLPAVSLGLWQNFGYDRPLDVSRAIVRRAFDLGITHFDLANNYGPPYGSAETTFGLLMKQDLAPYRDELIVSSKAGYDMWPGPYGEWGSRKYLLASLDQSLQRMDVDYVDIFYSHRFDPETPLEETKCWRPSSDRSETPPHPAQPGLLAEISFLGIRPPACNRRWNNS